MNSTTVTLHSLWSATLSHWKFRINKDEYVHNDQFTGNEEWIPFTSYVNKRTQTFSSKDQQAKQQHERLKSA